MSKWIGGCQDSSDNLRKRRNAALSKELYITKNLTGTTNLNNITVGGFNFNLKSVGVSIDNSAKSALHRTRSGGSAVPLKVSSKNIN